ncbi:uncharacterized protein [Temnothorax nylanderi]|uniref:uncharacterized protein n=1 Tax=Temnothorax nylanderi TaxID=102681 RepID=UPI003A869463
MPPAVLNRVAPREASAACSYVSCAQYERGIWPTTCRISLRRFVCCRIPDPRATDERRVNSAPVRYVVAGEHGTGDGDSSNNIPQLNTVTYGEADAQFLATRTVQQFAEDEMEDFPEAARAVIEDSYVDDVTTGASTIQRLKDLQQQLQCLMRQGGFELHKWASNYLQWDNPLPDPLQKKWITFRKQLNDLVEIKIPRCALPLNAVALELHRFGDASELGFGCCIYLRGLDQIGNYTINLLCKKSKVSPLKKTTIPRLELQAALLLAELAAKVIGAIALAYRLIGLWTDSTIILYRIRLQSSRYTIYVANRIARIQELSSPEQWRYVPGDQNPADLVSRGLLPEALSKADNWFRGPAFLTYEESEWPSLRPGRPEPNDQTDEELKKTINVVSCVATVADRVMNRYSSYTKTLRISARCRRFAANCKATRDRRDYGPLSASELNETLLGLGRVQSLRPYLDENHILRVGGQLQNSGLEDNQRHPMRLHAKHSLSRLIARHYHEANLHAGPQTLLYTLRQQFWIIDGRNLCQKTVHTCVRCFRAKPIVAEQLISRLPAVRVQPARLFLRVGIDFCGPFNCKPRIRSKAVLKTYVCVFVCFPTKAVHMEIVNDLTTDAFLAALRRFVARRGRCTDIFSDNATNFVGGNRALQELYELFQNTEHQEIVQRFCTNEGITWHMIPPNSLHFGGLWESAVKAAKHHMRRALGTALFTTEELGTVVTQIEACLNSRPLSPHVLRSI